MVHHLICTRRIKTMNVFCSLDSAQELTTIYFTSSHVLFRRRR
ncbi:hypothetical protein [Marininema mesophilum]|nr:hypothetical protein [Marininema mesophilum]